MPKVTSKRLNKITDPIAYRLISGNTIPNMAGIATKSVLQRGRSAYRLPVGLFPVDRPFTSQEDSLTVPITEIVVNSIIADPLEAAQVDRSGFEIHGVAWDRGTGINRVEVSLDGGQTWQDALLDRPLGAFAFRRFSLQTGLMRPGTYKVLSRATNHAGERQVDRLKPNPGGYHNNLPRQISVVVA